MVYSEAFQEAFDRFEKRVNIKDLESAQELISSYANWAGYRYTGSTKQLNAIREQAERRGLDFDWNLPTWIKKKDYEKYYARGYGSKPSQTWKTTVQYGKYRGLKDKQISTINEGIREGKSANQIQRELRSQGFGIRRKELLRDIREMKMKSPRANTQKYTPRKYRK